MSSAVSLISHLAVVAEGDARAATGVEESALARSNFNLPKPHYLRQYTHIHMYLCFLVRYKSQFLVWSV
jgi:hypothetical protein